MSLTVLPRSQQGMALIIGLVLIFAISLLGVSVMLGSRLEMRMAGNSSAAVIAFQAAESATDAAFADVAHLVAASAREGVPVALDLAPVNDGIGVVLDTTIEHTSTGMAAGFSVGSGSFRGFRYRVRSSASITDSDAEARIEQGAVQAVPSL